MKTTLCIATLCCALTSAAQEREDRTLYSWAQMRSIINEASGERAMHHVLELAPYPRMRTRDEYEKRFRESDVNSRLFLLRRNRSWRFEIFYLANSNHYLWRT